MPAVPPPRPRAPNFPQLPMSDDPISMFNTLNSIINYLAAIQINTATPGPITQFTAVADNLANVLSWNPAPNASFYYIYKNSTSNFAQASLVTILNASKIQTLGKFTYDDSSDSSTATRYYWVLPINEQGVAGPLSPMAQVDNFFTQNNGNAQGVDAQATGLNSTAIGIIAQATGDTSMAIGANAISGGSHAITVGANSQVQGISDTAVGDGNTISSSGDSNIVFGHDNTVSGVAANNLVFGFDNTLTHINGVVIGNSYTDTADGQMVLKAPITLRIITNAVEALDIDSNQIIQIFSPTDSGAVTANLTNGPLNSATPYVWVKIKAPDGTLCSIPFWKHS